MGERGQLDLRLWNQIVFWAVSYECRCIIAFGDCFVYIYMSALNKFINVFAHSFKKEVSFD